MKGEEMIDPMDGEDGAEPCFVPLEGDAVYERSPLGPLLRLFMLMPHELLMTAREFDRSFVPREAEVERGPCTALTQWRPAPLVKYERKGELMSREQFEADTCGIQDALDREITHLLEGPDSFTITLDNSGARQVTIGDAGALQGQGTSSRSFAEATERAKSDRRYRLLIGGGIENNEVIDRAVREAIERFGGSDGVFNTASFQTAINISGYPPIADDKILLILANHMRVVRLAGGDHWLLLPSGMKRYQYRPGEGIRMLKASGPDVLIGPPFIRHVVQGFDRSGSYFDVESLRVPE
jgi:hypothetical protein